MVVPVRITRGQPVSDLCCCSLWQEQKPAECGLSRNNPSGLEHRDIMGEKTAALAFFKGCYQSWYISVQGSVWPLALALGSSGFY